MRYLRIPPTPFPKAPWTDGTPLPREFQVSCNSAIILLFTNKNLYHLGDPLQLLPYASDAPFNACGKDDDPLCLPNTRVELLNQIREWANKDDERHIFWLSGWAGTGKSTIARTVAREHYDRNNLAASFFFSRGGGDVGHAGKFFT